MKLLVAAEATIFENRSGRMAFSRKEQLGDDCGRTFKQSSNFNRLIDDERNHHGTYGIFLKKSVATNQIPGSQKEIGNELLHEVLMEKSVYAQEVPSQNYPS